jgi:DNA-binding GntR family transcriptional regulator
LFSASDAEDLVTAPLWRQLADDLIREIRSGQRAPGSQLPSYVDLSGAGYSQATVARAYRELADQGLLVAVPGSGSYVADPVPPPIRPVPDVLADHEARIAELEILVHRLLAKSGSDQAGETS